MPQCHKPFFALPRWRKSELLNTFIWIFLYLSGNFYFWLQCGYWLRLKAGLDWDSGINKNSTISYITFPVGKKLQHVKSEVYLCSEPHVSRPPHTPPGRVGLHSGGAGGSNKSWELRELSDCNLVSAVSDNLWMWYDIFIFLLCQEIMKENFKKYIWFLQYISSHAIEKWSVYKFIHVNGNKINNTCWHSILKGLYFKHNNMIFLTKNSCVGWFLYRSFNIFIQIYLPQLNCNNKF